ncbi:hypothetical protein IV203_003922 [Nitzschia inconspicua]|uniref:Uncharacterized protein n=1 Tax=Nitzschia inconspicua TaxID=303405 RepID=A0A9K3PPN4_9STRA|nr:hypothetical protein IV203_003922 [Nitzschia inconspicua]
MVRVFPHARPSSTTVATEAVLSKPRRILGFNPAVGRGYVVSMDQRHHPEFLFIDTPSHPNLQMVCSRIIDEQGENIAANNALKATDRPLVGDLTCEDMTFRFIIRFVCPQSNPELLGLLERVYFEGEYAAKYGMLVVIPAIQGTRMESLWGSSSTRRGGRCEELSYEIIDKWIEGIARDDSSPY